jgi:hypothetical protein
MSSDTAFKDISLNSSTSLSELTRDEDVLKVLKLQESDLDRFASYFELVFQGNARSITVLVALLQRLCGVEALRQQKHSGIWIEDVVGRLTHRLYTRGEPGQEAASRFGTEASDLAEQIFSEALAVRNES